MQMHNILKVSAIVFVTGAASLVFSACQSSSQSASSPSSQSSGAEVTQPAANTVTIQNMAFSPQDLHVKLGQTVTWKNDDQLTHTVTSDTGVFESGNVASGGTYSFTFTKAGTFAYHCNIHTSMTAKVTVTE